MDSLLETLRTTSQLSPRQFLAAQPGCWVQYYDDTGARDPAKALSMRFFDLAIARRKQQSRCAVCFSLQAFGQTRTKEGLLCFRNLGVDVDLVPAQERLALGLKEIDGRKEDYLRGVLLPFPLKPHWLIETRHGFHAIFRILPLRDENRIREAAAVNLRLVRVLRGDEHAALQTQVLRVPGTLQFKIPDQPFLCRLLVNNASAIPPYDLGVVRGVVERHERMPGHSGPAVSTGEGQVAEDRKPTGTWRDGLGGVAVGRRNATAAAIVGSILGRLPEELWEAAGWGGLKEWNGKNAVPLPERELRSVFESIARRERNRRGQARQGVADRRAPVQVRVSVQVSGNNRLGQAPGAASVPRTDPAPAGHAEH